MKYCILILCFLLLSCKGIEDKVLSSFKESNELKYSHKLSLDDYDILKPINAIKYEDRIIITEDRVDNIFTIIDLNKDSYTKGVSKGSGPNEVNLITSVEEVQDSILLFDTSSKKIFKLNMDNRSLLSVSEIKSLPTKNRSSIIKFANDAYLSSGMFGNFWIGFYDLKTDSLYSHIPFPYFENMKDLKDIQKSVILLNSLITVNPQKNKFVVASMKSGLLSFCNITSDKKVKEFTQLKYYQPEFDIIDDYGNIAYNKQYKVAFCDIDSDDDFVYVLYSGRSFESHGMLNHHCEHLLIYDWNGIPVRLFKLEVPLTSMKYDKENNSIYGIAYNPEGTFIEYQL